MNKTDRIIAVPDGETIVSMIEYLGTVFVSTDLRVYQLRQGDHGDYRLAPIRFVEDD